MVTEIICVVGVLGIFALMGAMIGWLILLSDSVSETSNPNLRYVKLDLPKFLP